MGKHIEFNFNINEKTVNGRKYDKQNLLEQFDSFIKNKKLFVYPNIDNHINNCNDITKAIGFVEFYTERDGVIEVDISLTNPDLYEIITEESKVTICGVGKIEDSVVKDFKLTHLILTDTAGD